MQLRRLVPSLLLMVCSAGPASAIDGVAFEIGSGDSVDMARVAVQWDWKKRWFQGANWHLGGYWDVAFGY